MIPSSLLPKKAASVDDPSKFEKQFAILISRFSHSLLQTRINSINAAHVIMIIRHVPDLHFAQLASMLRISAGGMKCLADSLCEKGWTEKRPIPGNKRKTGLQMTEWGNQRLEKILQF